MKNRDIQIQQASGVVDDVPVLRGVVHDSAADPTSRDWAADHLIERNHLLGTVLRNIDASIYLKDSEGRYLYVNDKALEVYGRTLDEVLGRSDREVLGPKVAQDLIATDRLVLDSMSRHACEEILLGPDGKERHYWSIKLPLVRPGQPTCLIGISTEITELLRLRQTLERERTTDTLTGLPNRVQFVEELTLALHEAARDARSLAVVMLDIDQFKYINTHLGQDAGDLLLREVAQRLRRVLPASCSVARLEGDAFAVVVPSITDCAEVEARAQALRGCLAEPVVLRGEPFHMTASAGLVVFPDDGLDAETLLTNAEAAMYSAKERGRDQSRRYTAQLSTAASFRVTLENDLRAALGAKQFELHYQPKIRSSDNRVAGVEALLRWNRPGHGTVPPLHFIPLAEQLGLLVQIGAWVVEEACRQMAQWREGGLGRVSVAVNLSPSQLKSRDLIDQVRASMRRHGIGPGELEMEVTESMMMDEPEQAIAILHGLAAAGIHLSIDDFGTGFSSMAYLKRLPVAALKLDRQFVKEVATDARDSDLCAGVIALAHKLGLQVVAEGVETEAQRRALLTHDCDLFQGYLFSRPLPAGELEAYLHKRLAP